MNTPDERLPRALRSLEGLSIGDAWGERFAGPAEVVSGLITERRLPERPWRTTDDTEMALAIVEELAAHREVDPSALARAFVRRFVADPERGYGAGTATLLQQMRRGASWQEAAGAVVLLGSGDRLLSSDTVPFALWCACRWLHSFEEAMWSTVAGLGDRDTTCAIVGGLVALRSPPPPAWVEAREPLRFESSALQAPERGWRRLFSRWEQALWSLSTPGRRGHKA